MSNDDPTRQTVKRSHKRLDPEIKALRAVDRALGPLEDDEATRVLQWACARQLGVPWVTFTEVRDG